MSEKPAHDFDEFNGQPYLVMELADHGSLDNRIERSSTTRPVAQSMRTIAS